MRMFIMIMAFSLSSCAHQPRDADCTPEPPTIGKDEALKDYTIRIINLYKKCVTTDPARTNNK